MDTRNLAELYEAPTMEWQAVCEQLVSGLHQDPGSGGPGRHTTWLTTLNRDGSPHVTALGALWHDEAFWFCTGRHSRKGRNLARDPRCALSVSVRELDLVVEGSAHLVGEADAVAAVAARWSAEEGWPCRVDDSGVALTAPYSAQSAGPPPWHVYRIEAASAQAVATVEPFGATRWTF